MTIVGRCGGAAAKEAETNLGANKTSTRLKTTRTKMMLTIARRNKKDSNYTKSVSAAGNLAMTSIIVHETLISKLKWERWREKISIGF